MKDILVLGDGLLGSEIVKQTGWDFISRKKNGFDFNDLTSYAQFMFKYQTIFNAIGNTDTYSKDRNSHLSTNYNAVCDLVDWCNFFNKKLVHVSTDMLYSNSVENASEEDIPVHTNNWYSYYKLLADGYVQLRSKNYLLIRTSFKPYPFPYPKAITTQYGNFDYAPVISDLIIKLINKGATGAYNVGTASKTIYELALQTNPAVEAWDHVLDLSMPRRVDMNITKMERFLND